MKKIFALLIALMMVFALVACDTGDDPNPSGSNNPGSSQSGNQGGGENDDGGWFDLADSKIYVNDGYDISLIPAPLKKALGSKEQCSATLGSPVAYTDTVARFSIKMEDVTREDFETLVDYYETTFGKEATEDFMGNFTMELDWGTLDVSFSESISTISVNANLKGDDGGEQGSQSVGVEWPDNEYTRLVPELPASILAICTDTYVVNSLGKCGFSYYDVDPSLEDMLSYMQALKDAGFTENMNDEFTTDAAGFHFSASNAEGYKVTFTNDYFAILKPQYKIVQNVR